MSEPQVTHDVNAHDALDDLAEHDEFERYETVRAKWTMDGASTLDEAATLLEDKAAWLRERAAQGYDLAVVPIQDDYAFLAPPAPASD